MAKKQINIRMEDKTIEKLDMLVLYQNVANKQLSEEIGAEIKTASRVDILSKLIDIAFERIED